MEKVLKTKVLPLIAISLLLLSAFAVPIIAPKPPGVDPIETIEIKIDEVYTYLTTTIKTQLDDIEGKLWSDADSVKNETKDIEGKLWSNDGSVKNDTKVINWADILQIWGWAQTTRLSIGDGTTAPYTVMGKLEDIKSEIDDSKTGLPGIQQNFTSVLEYEKYTNTKIDWVLGNQTGKVVTGTLDVGAYDYGVHHICGAGAGIIPDEPNHPVKYSCLVKFSGLETIPPLPGNKDEFEVWIRYDGVEVHGTRQIYTNETFYDPLTKTTPDKWVLVVDQFPVGDVSTHGISVAIWRKFNGGLDTESFDWQVIVEVN